MAKNDSKAQMAKWLVAGGLSIGAALGGSYLIIPWEGSVKDKAGNHIVYLDAVNVPTACYGQTGKDLYNRTIKLGMKYTEQECIDMLAKTIRVFEKGVDDAVKVTYASEYQKAALVSFSYNVGLGNFRNSTLLRKLNQGSHEYACEELSKWVYAQKKKLGGLVNRREDERLWCIGQVPYEATVTYSNLVDFTKETYVPPANPVTEKPVEEVVPPLECPKE